MNLKFIIRFNRLPFLIIWVVNIVYCFSPLTNKIDLHDTKTFVISSYEDDYNDDENELIQPEEIEHIESLANDEDNIDFNNLVKNDNSERSLKSNTNFKWKNDLSTISVPFSLNTPEKYYDYDETTSITGLNQNTIYDETSYFHENILNNLSTIETFSSLFMKTNYYNLKSTDSKKHNIEYEEKKIEMEYTPTIKIVEYKTKDQMTIKELTIHAKPTDSIKVNDKITAINSEKIIPEYSLETEEIKSNNFTYNFTEDEIQRSLRKIINKAFNLKKLRNCSQIENFQFGIEAIKCVVSDFQMARNRTEVKKVFQRSWKITRIWLCIYVCIAISCWCQKGWCCCCFRCKICFPNKIIIKEKKYFSKNPPGILVDVIKKKHKSNLSPITYAPTMFEKVAYEKFENAMSNL